MRNMIKRTAILAAVLISISMVRFVQIARSSVLSTADQRLTVYRGVVTVTSPTDLLPDGVTPRTIEFGAYGTDIVANDDIVLRPGVTNSTLTRFIGRANSVQDLSISGNLSLATNGKTVCIGPYCRSSWSRVPEHWESKTINYGAWSHTFLEPETISDGIRIGTSVTPYTNGTAINADGIYVTNHSGGYAAYITGNVGDIGLLTVYGTILINSRRPFAQNYQGAGTGLDADNLDGLDATVHYGYTCDATACFCLYGTPTNHSTIDVKSASNRPICVRMFASDSLDAPY